MAKPSYKDRQKLTAKETKLQEMRTQSKMKRDVTVAISSEGFHTTGLMCDIVQVSKTLIFFVLSTKGQMIMHIPKSVPHLGYL